MKEKCKACSQREGCNGLNEPEPSIDEVNNLFNHLLMIEDEVGKILTFSLIGRPVAAQWAFFNAMANKLRVLADELKELLPDNPFIKEFDFDKMQSIVEMSEEHQRDDKEGWFTGDVPEV